MKFSVLFICYNITFSRKDMLPSCSKLLFFAIKKIKHYFMVYWLTADFLTSNLFLSKAALKPGNSFSFSSLQR